MTVRSMTIGASVVSCALLMTAAPLRGQAPREVFTATATVKMADGRSGSAPVTITINRVMSKDEAEPLVTAFRTGGATALRKSLVGVPTTGSVRVGDGKVTPTRFTIEREVGGGRLLTIVTDQPLVFIGAAAAGAKPKTGYDFGVIDIQVDAAGTGSGTIAPAATLKLNQTALVVEDYSGEVVRLTAVKKAQ